MTTKHWTKKLSDRTVTFTVREYPERLDLILECSRYADWVDSESLNEFKDWIIQLLAIYDSDPRPQHFNNPLGGEHYTIIGNDENFVALIEPSLKPMN